MTMELVSYSNGNGKMSNVLNKGNGKMSNVLNNGSVCALYLALEITGILIAVFCFLLTSLVLKWVLKRRPFLDSSSMLFWPSPYSLISTLNICIYRDQ